RAGGVPGGCPASAPHGKLRPAPGWSDRVPERSAALRRSASVLLPEFLGDSDRHLRHFEQLLDWNRRFAPFLDGMQECGGTAVLPLVLPPGSLLAEPGPVEPLQRTIIVELQSPSGREHLDSFLGEGSPAVGQFMD